MQQSALATVGTMLMPHFLKALEHGGAVPSSEKTLVVVQLSGGNDGLNTVVPFRNDIYYQLRPQLALPASNVLKASDELGFHPALQKLRRLYDQGYLSVINNVGYPNPDRSHFRSMDIWQTASDSHEYLNTGWIGRYLDASCHDCQTAHSAVEIDDMLSLAMKGESVKGLAMKNPQRLHQILHNPFIAKVNDASGQASNSSLHYLYKTLAEASSSADYIYDKSKVFKSSAQYPDTALGKQLKTVAELIQSGIQSKVFYVSFSGFDTHVRQQPQHERLLNTYADALHSFVGDLEKSDDFKNVLVLTFSEFGRRVSQNASNGTDHGTANNVFIIGKQLKKAGFLNGTPNLTKLDNGDLIHEVDFRQVYATILNKWLGANDQIVLGKRFGQLQFI